LLICKQRFLLNLLNLFSSKTFF